MPDAACLGATPGEVRGMPARGQGAGAGASGRAAARWSPSGPVETLPLLERSEFAPAFGRAGLGFCSWSTTGCYKGLHGSTNDHVHSTQVTPVPVPCQTQAQTGQRNTLVVNSEHFENSGQEARLFQNFRCEPQVGSTAQKAYEFKTHELKARELNFSRAELLTS